MHMQPDTEQPSLEDGQTRVVSYGLLVAAVLCVVASGLLLWARYGGSVFNDMVLSALAWCF